MYEPWVSLAFALIKRRLLFDIMSDVENELLATRRGDEGRKTTPTQETSTQAVCDEQHDNKDPLAMVKDDFKTENTEPEVAKSHEYISNDNILGTEDFIEDTSTSDNAHGQNPMDLAGKQDLGDVLTNNVNLNKIVQDEQDLSEPNPESPNPLIQEEDIL